MATTREYGYLLKPPALASALSFPTRARQAECGARSGSASATDETPDPLTAGPPLFNDLVTAAPNLHTAIAMAASDPDEMVESQLRLFHR